MDIPFGPLTRALMGGVLSGLFVGAGALCFSGAGTVPRRGLLALAAGAMLGAAVFALGLPAAARLSAQADFLGTILPLMAGILLGAGGGRALNQGLDGLQVRWRAHGPWALAGILAMHNLPEGLAIGATLAAGTPTQWLPVLGGISLHNLLEGAAVAALARGAGWSPRRAVLLALGAGLTEPLGALAGAACAGASPTAVPWMLMVSAGAMIEVVRGEVLPELRGRGAAYAGLLALALGGVAVFALLRMVP